MPSSSRILQEWSMNEKHTLGNDVKILKEILKFDVKREYNLIL